MPSGRRLRINPEARDDIRDVLQYTLQTWGRGQRDRYQALLLHALQEIAEFPNIGQLRDDLGQEYRSRLVEQHVVYYRVEPKAIRVIRVLHVRRDAPRELT